MVQQILEVNNLVVRFHSQDGTVHAVNGVSFHVAEGETLGIVGESGCGKSVTVLSMLQLLPQPPGDVKVDSVTFRDRDLAKLSDREMREIRGHQISMVFQDPMTSLNPVLTVGFQIMEPLRGHLGMTKDQARTRAVELLHLVGIPDARKRLDDYPHEFSGGMKQRALIAMALACNPRLLIADEPTTALDVTIQEQILRLVKDLRDQLGMSLIWITHDLGVIAGLADRVMVMYAGFGVEEGSVRAIYETPRHPYTIGLLQCRPRVDGAFGGKLKSIEGLPPELHALPTGCPFVPRCVYAKDRCRVEVPMLEQIEPGHSIACWVDTRTGEAR